MPFIEPPASYAKFFWGWNRLEARSRHDEFQGGLRAPVADPLWQLARQWQIHEFAAKDAAIPIDVEVAYEIIPVDRLKLGSGPVAPIGNVPVEVAVEQESVDWDWRTRIRAGQQFEKLARKTLGSAATALIDGIRADFPVVVPVDDDPDWVETDDASRRFVRFMSARGAIDGKLLFDSLAAGSLVLPSGLDSALQSWYSALYAQQPVRWSAAWRSDALDYTFQMQATDPQAPGPLRAKSYRNGTIDWSTFTLVDRGSDSPSDDRTGRLTPAHANFPGMPVRRWFEFEDAAVNFGNVAAATTDVAKLMLLNFALVFGDDWFVVPLTAMPNSLVRVKRLVVRDSFGLATEIPRARDTGAGSLAQWDAFALTSLEANTDPGDFLFVPPPTGSREESQPLEEIHLAKDEGANMVWAIEHVVPSALGEPMRGHEAHLQTLRRRRAAGLAPVTEPAAENESASSVSDADLEYVLETKVPPHWIPFVPLASMNTVNGVPRRSVKLRRAQMLTRDVDAELIRISALSRLLKPGENEGVRWINEEAVGRAGARVELRRQRVRSSTGETYVWLGRKISTGRGESRSGLKFDVATDRTRHSDL